MTDKDYQRILNRLFARMRRRTGLRIQACDLELAGIIAAVELLLSDPRMPEAIFQASLDAVVQMKVYNRQVLTAQEYLKWSDPVMFLS